MGDNTGEDVTTEIHQPIEHQHIEQLVRTLKKKKVNVLNIK